MLEILIFLVVLVIVSRITYIQGKKSAADSGYWKGRAAGWKACEDMVINRAKERLNLTEEEAWEKLVQ